jgi:uncharacterized membrane protein
MQKKPRIKIEMTISDKVVELIGWLTLLAIWILTITSYSNLSEIIPIHYNAAGQIDGFGEKANILILPLYATVFFVGLTILNKFPHIFNYPIKITQGNALTQYTNMTKMFRYLKLVIVLMFGFFAYKTVKNSGGIGSWFLPLTIGLIIVFTTYFLIKSYKTRP